MEQIKDKIKDFFKKMGIEEAEIEIKKDNSFKQKEFWVVDVTMEPKEAGRFLCEEAEGLSALQHLLRQMITKKDPTKPFLVVDINNYKRGRERKLIELATKVAQKVRRTKKAVVLTAMPASDRRVIHIKLAEYPDIVTESMGEEPDRKVVVRPYP